MARKPRTPTLFDPDATAFAMRAQEPHVTMEPRVPSDRLPDLIWETVCELWYPSGVPTHPKSTRAHVNGVVRGLRSIGATPAEIRVRANQWATVFPSAACTAQGVLNQWDRLAVPKQSLCRGLHNWHPVAPPAGTVRTCRKCGATEIY